MTNYFILEQKEKKVQKFRTFTICIFIHSEDEYEELDYRAENQYWMANKQLNIEGATAYAHEKALADESSNMSVSSLAVNKLARWELRPPPHPPTPQKSY